jgi:FO synthase
MARLIFAPEVTIQAPPNLSPGMLDRLIDAGLNDWGGVSPVTPDHVNPEAPWPHLDVLAERTADCGKTLVERLAIYPDYALNGPEWLDPDFMTPVLRLLDADGLPRTDDWLTGAPQSPPDLWAGPAAPLGSAFGDILKRAGDGVDLSTADVTRLFGARGGEFVAVCQAADDLRRQVNGDNVTYIVTRNINYTNVCYFKCQFCAFSKGKMSENLRGKPYDLDQEEITRRAREAWARGATEVCMQGGIHPEYTGQTYLDICRAVKAAVPGMHVHAFSPLEVWQGARTLNLDLGDYLAQLREAGLGSLPGTAAEILDDEVRATLCADKVNTLQWLDVMRTAHNAGIRTTSTIMYGHIERPVHWARHLLHLRDLQKETGGFTEFVPLPFVASEAPIYLKGQARRGPTFRESVLMHAVARLALHPHITNIQTSWVKMGPHGAQTCLNAGANDLGGTLMNETITRAAGAEHGQEMAPEVMEETIRAIGRTPVQRTTFYETPPAAQVDASFNARDLGDVVNTPARRYERDAKPTLYRPGLNAAQ